MKGLVIKTFTWIIPPSQFSVRRAHALFPCYSKVAVGSVILANRYNDVWDKATITEIHSHELVEEVTHNSYFTSINHRLEVMNFRHNVLQPNKPKLIKIPVSVVA